MEAESHRIGDRYLPPALWSAMKRSGGVEIRMPLAGRVEHLLGEYARFLVEPELLKRQLGRLGGRRPVVWNRLIDAGDWPALAADLLESHYDPGYTSSLRRNFPGVVDSAALGAVSDENLDALLAGLIGSCNAEVAGIPGFGSRNGLVSRPL